MSRSSWMRDELRNKEASPQTPDAAKSLRRTVTATHQLLHALHGSFQLCGPFGGRLQSLPLLHQRLHISLFSIYFPSCLYFLWFRWGHVHWVRWIRISSHCSALNTGHGHKRNRNTPNNSLQACQLGLQTC